MAIDPTLLTYTMADDYATWKARRDQLTNAITSLAAFPALVTALTAQRDEIDGLLALPTTVAP